MVKITRFKPDEVPEYRFAGIASGLRDYRMAFLLGRALQLDFKQVLPITTGGRDQARLLSFPVFTTDVFDPDGPSAPALFVNRLGNDFMFPKLRVFEFFFRFGGMPDAETCEEQLKIIRSVEGVSLAQLISGPALLSLRPLQVEEELPKNSIIRPGKPEKSS
jgi:hypothetical protein